MTATRGEPSTGRRVDGGRRRTLKTKVVVLVSWTEAIVDRGGHEYPSMFALTKAFSTLDEAKIFRARVRSGSVLPAAAHDVEIEIPELESQASA